MKVLKPVVYTVSFLIFGICLYIFLLGNGMLDGLLNRATTPGGVGTIERSVPSFHNDPFSWYFLAKGMFCSLSLYLSVTLIEAIHGLKAALVQNVQKVAQPSVQTAAVEGEISPLNHTVVANSGQEKAWYQARQGVGH